MNKTEAKRYAFRWLGGILEMHLSERKPIPIDPMVYDCMCEKEIEGRRLSNEDEIKVMDALEEITKGWYFKGLGFDPKNTRKTDLPKFVKATGKPGAKYKDYKGYRKRCGYKK